ncbi:MAG: oxidoreductase [Hyphomicrobiales bacterium]|nr:oxidoreductase [Hyphomicrobiales bacterium]
MLTFRQRLAAFAVVGLMFSAAPVAAAEFSDSQKSEIETVVREYLLKNPEILRDAYAELETRQARAEGEARTKALSENGGLLTNSPHQAVIGNPDGKVTLVEFFDYNCGYCKQALPDLQRLVKEQPDLRVVLKDFPVLGPGSVEAAQVAIALRNQLKGEKYWAFHLKLLATRGQVAKAAALAAAKDAGADMDKLNKDIAGAEVTASLQEVAKLADSLSLSGTPTYIVGDEVVVGAVGYAQLKGRLDNVRKCGKATCG